MAMMDAIARDSLSAHRPCDRRQPLAAAYVALVLFSLIYFSRPEDWFPGLAHVPLAKIAGILAICAMAFSLPQVRRRMPREIFFLMFLIAQLFVASLMSPVWRGGAFQLTLNFAKVLIIVFVIAATVNTVQRLRVLVLIQAISVSAIAAVAMYKSHLVFGRLEGSLGAYYTDPNDMALVIIISLPLCLALMFLTGNRFLKMVWSISIATMIYAIFLTGSRGGFFALLVVAAVCLWQFAVKGRRRYLLMLAPLAVVVLLYFSGGMLVGRLKGTFDVNDDTAASYDSAQARQELLWRSIEITLEHPLFGVGPGNFNQVSGQWRTTHNSVTLMSSEGGLPALLLYVAILWCGFENLRLTTKLARGRPELRLLAGALLASLAGYAVGSLFLSMAYLYFPYILVGYTTALFAIARKSPVKSREPESARNSARKKNLYFGDAEIEMSVPTS